LILIIDNYDSFVYNLARYSHELGYKPNVERNDSLSLQDITNLNPSHIIISPGPCTPREAGISNDVIREFGPHIPILGVCLGHQCIGEVFGARIVKAPMPMHGKVSQISHNGEGVFKDLPPSYEVTRYHSLVIDPESLPQELSLTAQTEDGIIMGVSHTKHPIYGVQFHPEAHLTQYGHQLLSNFFSLKALAHAA
jgi:anthranilate synthase/aminodeoxychorismate synthase-like glutamine amidotransferase